MFTTQILIDADYGTHGWEIAVCNELIEGIAAWSDVSDEQLSTLIGPEMAAHLISSRDATPKMES